MIQKPLPPLGSDIASVWVAPDLQLVVQVQPRSGEAVVEGFDSDGNHLDTLARFADHSAAVAALAYLIPLARTLFAANAQRS